MLIAIGADHAGFDLKTHLLGVLEEAGHTVDDLGTTSTEPVDYPPIMAAVGRAVAGGGAERGIVVGGSGQGEQIAANKVPGVRAALCNDLYTARMARQHNDANVLSLGARVVAAALAEEIVALFLSVDFGGGRHQRRVDLITGLEAGRVGETMSIDEAIYTTRAMRRLAPDPIPDDAVAAILDAAVRGPSGGNQQRFRFLTVTDPGTKAVVAEHYRAGLDELHATAYADVQARIAEAASATPDAVDPEVARSVRIDSSARWLADHLDEAPLLLFAFGKERGESSTFPALWNACLKARSLGIGSTITTLLRSHKVEVESLLGVPDDGEWHMHAMVPMGYPTGRWGLAERRPPQEVTFAERWGRPVGWRVDEPLWTAP